MERGRDAEDWLAELAHARGEGAHDRRYSAFVGVAKVALPGLALAFVAAIALWPTIEGVVRPEIGLARLDISNLERSPMLNALFQSVDPEQRPYRVAAVSAKPSASDVDLIELDRPRGAMRLDDGGELSVRAETGLFDRANRRLELFGAVSLLADDGHELRTELAMVDFVRGHAVSETPVEGDGPSGALRGSGLVVLDGGDVVVVTGPARALLLPARRSTAP